MQQAIRGDDRTDPYGVLGQSVEALERTRRELTISLEFAIPGATSHGPAMAYLRAVNAELGRRSARC